MSNKRERRKREQARRGFVGRPSLRKSSGPAPSGARAAQQMAESIRADARETASRHIEAVVRPDRDQRAGDSADPADGVGQLADATRNIALRVISASPQAARHACRAGCAYCCHTAVTVAPAEAIAIVRRLRGQCSPDELAEVRGRIETNAALAASMTRLEYTGRSIRCALLTDDGNCRVHAVRPLACAGFVSTSKAACEAEFTRAPGRGEVPLDPQAMVAGLSASYGLKEACERAGVDGEFYELHHALQQLLDVPEAAAQWTAGERLFDGCLQAERW